MPTSRRPKNLSIIQRLVETPHQFSFFQAVRLIERSTNCIEKDSQFSQSHGNKPVGRFFPPDSESIRFHSNQTLAFSAAEIESITKINESDNEQWKMLVNFMGLTGTQGVLPYQYTEMILQRLKAKDETLKKFFDLFNHRIISLFYQASNKYRIPIQYEKNKNHLKETKKKDDATKALLALIGLGTHHINNRMHVHDETLLYYSGLLSQQLRTKNGLEQILSRHFNITVTVEEFVGQWSELIDDVRTRLSSCAKSGQNHRLGKNFLLGKKGWSPQNKFRIILGPLDKQQAESFKPGSKTIIALKEIVQFYVHMEHEFDVVVRLFSHDALRQTQLTKNASLTLGWNLWLTSGNKHTQSHSDETLDILVSRQNMFSV